MHISHSRDRSGQPRRTGFSGPRTSTPFGASGAGADDEGSGRPVRRGTRQACGSDSLVSGKVEPRRHRPLPAREHHVFRSVRAAARDGRGRRARLGSEVCAASCKRGRECARELRNGSCGRAQKWLVRTALGRAADLHSRAGEGESRAAYGAETRAQSTSGRVRWPTPRIRWMYESPPWRRDGFPPEVAGPSSSTSTTIRRPPSTTCGRISARSRIAC